MTPILGHTKMSVLSSTYFRKYNTRIKGTNDDSNMFRQ